MSQHASLSAVTPSDGASERGAAVLFDGRGNAAVMEFWRPVIWSAVLGGAVAALGVQLILSLFGIGIGAALMDPWYDVADEIGVAAAIYTIISGMLSFGLGGWVAGRMSGVLRTGSGALHGVLAWAAAAVFGATVATLAGSAPLGGALSGAGMVASSSVGPAVGTPVDRTRTGAAPASPGDIMMTDAERRAAAEEAADGLARVALLTGGAFLLSLIAAGVGGTLGRHGIPKVQKRDVPRARPAPST